MVERRLVVSHAEAERVLRRAGYSQEFIEAVLRDFPDPFDSERDSEELFTKYGLTFGGVTDRMGGSP
ncbi:MAG: hypothetical protein ACTHQQ_16615 [Solirubrobacteraceae bacterium]